MFDSRGDRLCDRATELIFWPMELADRLPKGAIRFFGFIVAFPFCFPLLLLFFPLFLVGVIVQFWDYCHR